MSSFAALYGALIYQTLKIILLMLGGDVLICHTLGCFNLSNHNNYFILVRRTCPHLPHFRVLGFIKQ